MKRSRVTFAITEAAAIAALVASPPTTGRCSKPVGGTGKPSDRHRQSSQATRASTSLSAARLVLCSPRSSRNRREPVERRRRFARRASRADSPRAGGSSEQSDAPGGPVGGEGAADDPVARNGSPEPAVVGSPTVVAHHEVMVGGNGDFAREVAILPAAAGADELVLLTLPVQDHVPAPDRDPVTRAGDDALDEVDVGLPACRPVADLPLGRRTAAARVVLLGAGRRVEDDDVADVRIA